MRNFINLVEAMEKGCPPATQSIELNLKNRQKAIDEYHYGPLNPNEPNDEYWAELADRWNTDDIDSVKQNRCGNCGAFDLSENMQSCIAKGIGSEPGSSAMDSVDAGKLGYCKFLKFKCASKRTCDAWVVGGPIKFAGEKISFDYDETLSTPRGKELAKRLIAEGNIVYIISARSELTGMLQTAKDLGIPESRVYATGSNKAKIQKIKDLGISKHYDNNADVVKELGKIGNKFDIVFVTQFAETYNDYPKAARENAKIALNWAEKNGWGSCGTPVGKARANQLANGENISRDTIARMSAFERHRQSSQRELGDGCGRLMWLAWGGDEGIAWASRKLKQIDSKKFSQFQIISEDEKIISGPLMIADELIYRNNDTFGEHYVKFSADTIKEISIKFAKKKYQANVNLMHDQNQVVDGVTMFESFIVDKKRGILPMKGFEDVADGSWFGSFYVENPDVWNKIKSGELRGFSVEGLFDYEEPKQTVKQLSVEQETLNYIAELLKDI